jgi:phage repressor protein C with HTH and peptisase S24 domain
MNSTLRLQKAIDFIKSKDADLTNALIATALGYRSKTYITDMLGEGKTISRIFLEKLQNEFSISADWIETGKGEMLIDIPKENSSKKENYISKRREKKLDNSPLLVPFMPVKAQAGYVRAIDQEMFVETLEKYALPPGVDPTGAVLRYWEIQGDSMEGKDGRGFKQGDIILTSQVPRMDWDNLRNFYVYVIVTAEAVLIKRVYCKNPLEWVLISENEDLYPQQLIAAESVKEVWLYRRTWKMDAAPTKRFEIKV